MKTFDMGRYLNRKSKSKVSDPERFRVRHYYLELGIQQWLSDELGIDSLEVRVLKLERAENGTLKIDSQYRHPETKRWRTLSSLYTRRMVAEEHQQQTEGAH